MKEIILSINLNDDLAIKSCEIIYNDTGLKSDSELINRVAFALIKSIHVNKDSISVQDLLNETNLKRDENRN